jgi:SAM-dependent methyltransferase
LTSEYAEHRHDDVLEPLDNYTLFHYLLPPVLNECGLLTGKRVLDLACGDGIVTRLLESLDCDYMLGVDISSKLIRLARDIESKDPKGARYMVADAKKLPLSETPFDLVTAFYLLNYACTREELLDMAKNIYAQLGENKHFIGVTNNIEGRTDAFDQSKYGWYRHLRAPLNNTSIIY